MDDASHTPKPPTPSTVSLPSDVLADDEVDWTGKVLGEFRILHRLGRGGMGQVYLAEQTSLKRKVALKLLNPELAGNQRSLKRFKAEAENVARATHANIVQIYMIGEANGVNYIALEYVEGKNLGEFIIKKGTPELALGLHIMTQVASALQRASELGLIHRDIKPENILLTKKGEVKVADFGLSREFAESGSQPSLTQSQVTMGTPLYMSPEQVERKTVDPRTDIYSFGVTCYHMFAGTPPFRGGSPVDVAYKHVHEDPEPLAAIRPDLPAELCVFIHKMMAKKPEERYQTAREILRDINRLCDVLNLGTGAVSISASFLGSSAEMRNPSTQVWPDAPPAPSAWLRLAMIATVLAALGGGLVFGWFQHHRDVPQSKDPPNGQVQPLPIDPLGQTGRKPKVDEQELLRQFERYAQAEGPFQTSAGLDHVLDLVAFYFQEMKSDTLAKDKKFDKADRFFERLQRPDRPVPAYRLVADIGKAMVLAFRDKPAESNKAFLALAAEFDIHEKVLAKSKKDPLKVPESSKAYDIVWRQNARLREMVALALNQNFANDPAPFAEGAAIGAVLGYAAWQHALDEGYARRLNIYRIPPRPLLKKDPTPTP